jgi:acyl-CoA hydrolase
LNGGAGSSTSLVVYADGPSGPLPDPRGVSAIARLSNPQILLGWVVRRPKWLDETAVPVSTFLTGLGTRQAVRSGRVRSVPVRLSGVPNLMVDRWQPEVAVVGGIPDGDGFRFTTSLGWAPAAARAARKVVVEVWPAGTAAGITTPPIEGNVVEVIERTDPPDPAQASRPSGVERRIANRVKDLIVDGATVQWGPGSLGSAFVDAIDCAVSVHSGLVTNELLLLAARGLLTDPAITAYIWGGDALFRLAAAEAVRLAPVDYTHDVSRLSGIPRFTSFNTALQVGFDGSANVEQVGSRIISGPGGHPDFCLGASRSPGGLSVVAARAMTAQHPSIVDCVEVVSTPHTDIDVVVTEYGVADLRGLDGRERRDALRAIASQG